MGTSHPSCQEVSHFKKKTTLFIHLWIPLAPTVFVHGKNTTLQRLGDYPQDDAFNKLSLNSTFKAALNWSESQTRKPVSPITIANTCFGPAPTIVP